MNLIPILEGILFLVGDDGISNDKLKQILSIDDNKLLELITQLEKEYASPDRGLRLEKFGNSFKLTTKKEHKQYYEMLTVEETNGSLSPAALETLAIIAYNQPITRVKVDEIRGINSSSLVRKLLLRGLITEAGRADTPGRPILYGVTNNFLDYFGLKSTEELPEIKDVELSTEEKDLFESKYKEEL